MWSQSLSHIGIISHSSVGITSKSIPPARSSSSTSIMTVVQRQQYSSVFNVNASHGAQHMYVGSGGETTMDPEVSLWTILPIIRCM